MISSGADVAAATVLAVAGIAMQSLPVALVAGSLVAAAAFALALDVLKAPVFRHLHMCKRQRVSARCEMRDARCEIEQAPR